MQLALAERFNGDRAVKDLSRVLRLPGFFHAKGERFLSRIISAQPHIPPYTAEDFAAAKVSKNSDLLSLSQGHSGPK